uniref:Uncharacterized protein n=1 Tax=Arundo donax TaxID=35708 RepID=A0A0A9ENG1_ARUDO
MCHVPTHPILGRGDLKAQQLKSIMIRKKRKMIIGTTLKVTLTYFT